MLALPFISENATSIEITFWACALGGSLFFLVRVMLVLVGGFGDDFDTPTDDVDFDDTAGDAHHTEVAFKLFSLNTVSAFLMLFGWAGLTGLLQFELGVFISTAIAFGVGLFAMYITAWMYKAAYSLASPGAGFKMEEVVGLNASVYQKIPVGGMGKIQVGVNGMTRELKAQSDSSEDIESFKTVEVVGVINQTTVKVKLV